MSSAIRAFAAVKLLTRIREENPALWSRIVSFAWGKDEAGDDREREGSAGPECSDEADAGEVRARGV